MCRTKQTHAFLIDLFLIIIILLNTFNSGFGSPVEKEQRLDKITEFKLLKDLPKETHVVDGEELIFNCIATQCSKIHIKSAKKIREITF